MSSDENPLRRLRESICPNRTVFARQHGLNYQTLSFAETGLVNRPLSLVRVLAAETGQEEAQLMRQYVAWKQSLVEGG